MAKVMVFDHNSQKVSLEKRQKKTTFSCCRENGQFDLFGDI